MKKIVSFFGENTPVFADLNKKAAEYAASRGLQYKWVQEIPYNRADVIRELKDADAGIIDIEPYGEEVFKEVYASCKIFIRFGVGFDKVDLKAASKYHIAVARTVGANTNGVAEMAVTLILSSLRGLKSNMACVSTGIWKKNVTREISGSTVGIVGYGAIGQRVSELLKGFGCTVIAYDPFPNKELMEKNNVKAVSLEYLFTEADSISIHVPYTEETRNLVNEKLLGLMKPTSVIVNTSRGNIINEDDLSKALSEHRIAGAALDVFGKEPLPLESPLQKLDNIIMTPHVSSQTVESLWKIYKMAVDIAADFFDGKEPRQILNHDYKRAE
jgi:phosphoglycerate dehydrogenase-like enzyme